MADLYAIMKGKTYQYAQVATGLSNDETAREGDGDVFALLMSDSDHPRQAAFLGLIINMPEGHRQILLDGLAKEYADMTDDCDRIFHELIEGDRGRSPVRRAQVVDLGCPSLRGRPRP